MLYAYVVRLSLCLCLWFGVAGAVCVFLLCPCIKLHMIVVCVLAVHAYCFYTKKGSNLYVDIDACIVC